MDAELEILARAILRGDRSLEAARSLEVYIVEKYLEDDRFDELIEALSLYSPGGGREYFTHDELAEVAGRTLKQINNES